MGQCAFYQAIRSDLSTSEEINAELVRIEASGVLGRSPVYARLLKYLADATKRDKTASEVEIATDVFGKGGDFDSNQDSLVRVYVHNLRQRLDRYYEELGDSPLRRLSIPKGEYRLSLNPVTAPASVDPVKSMAGSARIRRFTVPTLVTLLLANLIGVAWLLVSFSGGTETDEVAGSELWSPLLESQRPLLVVVGDYYIFAELDLNGDIRRMVREFDINSEEDLDRLMNFDPERPYDYMDLDLTYLPQSTAFALKDLLRVVYASNKQVNVLPSSKLRMADLKSNDVLYVGYLSALGDLEEFVFKASQLRTGDTYDELVHKRSGQYYFSNAGIPEQRNYRDYGFLTVFRGPGADNRVMVVAGTRDAGLMQMAQVLSSSRGIHTLVESLTGNAEVIPTAYEALYQVTASDRTSIDAAIVYSAELDDAIVWSNDEFAAIAR